MVATSYQVCPDVCVQKGWTWVLFLLQASELSESVFTQYGYFLGESHSIWGFEYENRHDQLISSSNISDKVFGIVKVIVVISHTKIIVLQYGAYLMNIPS